MIHLNKHQRWTLIIAATIIALMFLFPPFQVETKAAGVIYSGYGFLFNAPVYNSRPATINVGTLAIQWVGVLLVAGLLMALFTGKKASDTKTTVPPAPLPVTASDPQDFSLANPWPRFFARTFDVWLEGLPVAIILIAVIPWFLRNNSLGALLLLSVFSLPAVFFLDALVFAVAGNTPGKALLGLKVVTTDGKPLSFDQYMRRNLSVWLRGYALGLPLVFLFTMESQYRRLSKGQQASYDEAEGFKVLAMPTGLTRKIVFGSVFVFLFLLAGVAGSIGEKVSTKASNASRTSEIYDPISRQQEVLKQPQEELAQRRFEAEVEKVSRAHPGWEKTISTKRFTAWMGKQPKSVQRLADSNKSEDAILMLDLYMMHRKGDKP